MGNEGLKAENVRPDAKKDPGQDRYLRRFIYGTNS